jgi:SAM-dependent methyltransferase
MCLLHRFENYDLIPSAYIGDRNMLENTSKNNENEWTVLDVGCGAGKLLASDERIIAYKHLHEGKKVTVVGIDLDGPPNTQADIVHDLKIFPWPMPENSVNQIIMNGVMEYLPDVKRTMEEMYRILKPEGILIIDSPYAVSHHTWTDPTHIRGFMSKSFDYFCINTGYYGGYIRTNARFNMRQVTFEKKEKRRSFIHRFLVSFFNKHKRLYEINFLYFLPMRWITFELESAKEKS